MVCFDTDFLIACLQEGREAIKKLEDLQESDDTAAVTTTVNAAKLWKGVYRSKKGQQEAAKVKRLLDSQEMIILDRDSARMVGELYAAIKSNPIGESDLLIASIVLANKQAIVTKNKKHFERVPGLQVKRW